MTGDANQLPAEASLRFTHGAPTAEEIAAVTAVVAALQNTASATGAGSDSGRVRRSRVQRRRLLAAAPQPWRAGRH